MVLLLGAIGLLFSPAKSAGASGTTATTVTQSGQVFASVGNSTVNIYDPTSGNLLNALVDNTSEPYTAGSAWDANGNFYVTDDTNGTISEYSPSGAPLPTFASGLTNPLSLTFDNAGNLYVGQQTTPYIAVFSPSGQRLPDIGPVATQLYGVDWIDLASNECTFYYTTEGTNIMTYNKCTNTQGPNFNNVPFPSSDSSTGLPVSAFELKILANGDVLVADSNADLLLDPNGNVIQTYPCSSMTNCGGQLFAISVDPSGTSFWTGDSASGDIYQVNLASGALMQTIATHSGTLYGLSVANQKEVATPPQTTTTTPSTLTLQPVTSNFSTPTPVSATLDNPSTGQPIVNEPVTFTLNGTESCTANTDVTGTATCVITPGEPSSSYTLTASFAGDASTSTPIGSNSSSSNFTVTPDSSSLTYTGPTAAVNGQPVTLSGTLTTATPTAGTPLPTKVVTFTIGTGTTAQSCNATTDVSGNVSCTIATVNQPATSTPITANFAGDTYDTTATATNTLSVTEPTVLTVAPATGDYTDATTVSGVLTDGITNAPIAGEPVVLTLSGTETCTGTTDATGTASCSVTPGEAAASYALSGNFAGDSALPLQLIPSSGMSTFVVTLEETGITYTGPTSVFNTQNLTVSGVLTADSGATPVVGRTVSFVLGSGSSAQTCTGTTTSTGAASCTINNVNQVVGPVPISVGFTSDGYYQSAAATATVQVGPVQVPTVLTVSPATSDYSDATTVSATLIDTYTNAGAANEPVTLTLNGTESCSGVTNASGVVSCSLTPGEPAGSYNLSASFAGDTTPWPHLEASTGSNTFVVTHEETAISYTGATSATNGSSATLSGVLTTDSGTNPVVGRSVVFILGSGSSSQSCSGDHQCHGCGVLRDRQGQPDDQPRPGHGHLRR